MAQRFGGKYSPTQSGPTEAADANTPRPDLSSSDQRRAAVLGLFSIALAISGFQGDARRLLLSLAGAGALLLGAWLTREGLRAADAFAARRIARRPALPRKLLGAGLTALALGLGSLAQHSEAALAMGLGLAGLVLHVLTFGPDPWHDKGAEGLDPFQTDRVARAVDAAETHLAAMKDAILRAKDRTLEARVERFAQTARGLFRSVENDPGDLTAARKFLSVYLQGARDATAKFVDLYAQNRDQRARADYETLLTDLETTFAARTTALLANGHTDLDVEVSVLRDRLKYEP